MNCTKCRNNISAYIDGMLDDAFASGMEKHLGECLSCRKEYESIMKIREICGKLPDVDLPFGFHEQLFDRLKREERKRVFKAFGKFNRRAVAGMAAALVLVLAGALVLGSLDGWPAFDKSKSEAALPSEPGTTDMAAADAAKGYELQSSPGAPADSDANYGDVGFRGEAEADSPREAGDVTAQILSGGKVEGERKIIRSAYMSIETTGFERTVDEILGKVSLYMGYIESSEIQGKPRRQEKQPANRKAHLEVRIPRKSFDQFISGLGDVGSVINQQVTGEDITGQYLDVEARLKSLKLQEERLLTILSKAELLQDIIELERELSNVRYEIENYTGTLKKWDNLIEYSKVTIDVYEVHEIKEEEPIPITLPERIINGFRRSCRSLGMFLEDLMIFTVSAVPYLAFLGLAGWFVWAVIIRPIARRRARRKEQKGDKPIE